MDRFLIGDTVFQWLDSCFTLKADELMEPFRMTAWNDAPVVYGSQFYPMEVFRKETLLQKNGMYELYQVGDRKMIIYHWAACRFGYGFWLDELYTSDPFTCYFNPDMKHQIPLGITRFFSTVGMHSKLLQKGAPVLHASYIDWNGRAILFSAPSQTGKSTQADLWKKYAGAEIINGDRALLRRRNGIWHAFGYPCCGSSQICVNRTLPLAAIVMLAQGPENRIESLSMGEKIRMLVSGTELYRWEDREMDMAFHLAEQIAQDVPMIRLVCRPDKEAVHVLQRFLKEG